MLLSSKPYDLQIHPQVPPYFAQRLRMMQLKNGQNYLSPEQLHELILSPKLTGITIPLELLLDYEHLYLVFYNI